MKASTVTLVPNGRLTEHIAHVDVRGEVPTLTIRNAQNRLINFSPDKVVITWQWSWTVGGWHVLEIKVLGRQGVRDVKAVFRDPDKAPPWVQEAVRMAAPNLVPAPRTPIDDAGENGTNGTNG